jgi:creatinine amidohydrolase
MVHESIGTSDVSWAGKPYTEVVAAAERDGSVLVVLVGSLEQHGHHLPTSTDTILVSAVAQTAAERVPNETPVIVTPPVWPGFSHHHLPFGGTASADNDDLIAVLEDVADSTLENGFDAIVFVNGHGGNAAAIASATSTVGSTYPDTEVAGLTYFDLGSDRIDTIRDSEHGGAGHAGEIETSMIMHLRPELLREDAIDGTEWDSAYERTRDDLTRTGPMSVYNDFDVYSDSGAVGAPSLASAEKGEQFFEIFVDELADVFERVHETSKGEP